MTSPLQMFGSDDAVCVDGVCHVPTSELEKLDDAPAGRISQVEPSDEPAE